MDNIIKNFTFLKLITISNKKSLHALIKSAKYDQLYSIFEIMHNLLIGNVNLEQNEINILKKYKILIRKLANKKNSIKEKKNVLLQKYNMLKTILTFILKKIDNEVCQKNDNGTLCTSKTRSRK